MFEKGNFVAQFYQILNDLSGKNTFQSRVEYEHRKL
jgi:hypothetical protein